MPPRKNRVNNNHLRVLLIAEEALVREGWKHALASNRDIELMDTPNTITVTKLPGFKNPPEIVLVGAAWLANEKRRKWLMALKSKYRTKIIAVAANAKETRKARQPGIDEAIKSPFSSHQLVQLIRGVSQDDKGLCMYYAEQLENMPHGDKYLDRYAELVSNILQLTFGQALTNPHLKMTSWSGNRFAHLIFENNSDQPFWSDIRKRFGVNYIIISMQNNPNLFDKQFLNLGKYLTGPVGRLGFVSNRRARSGAVGMLEPSLYHNEGKIIIILLDKQIRALLALKAAGVESTELIKGMYQDLIIAITGE